jgi:site-specific DNA-methyltransferase (adenine-specific)
MQRLAQPATSAALSAAPTQAVIEGDCRAVLQTFPTHTFAAAVFSPPYNLSKKYSLHNDRMPEAEYLAMQAEVARELARTIRPNGHVFLNVGWDTKHPWRSVQVAQEYARRFVLQNRITWVKSIALDASTLPESLRGAMHARQIGHFVSIRSENYLNPTTEDVWHLTPSGRSPIRPDAPGVGVPYVWKDQPKRFGHFRERHCRGNAVHIPYPTTQSRADRDHHPATFPVALPEYCLRLADLKPGDMVLDPFTGTGATLLAAKRLNLSAVGIEIDPAYCEAARRRLNRTGNGETG